MHDITSALQTIAEQRPNDPLAPVTVIAPSNIAALQLRRRLAEKAAYAAVRFETLPRLAELLAAGHLAARGRSPLARPIADYIAGQIALDSRGPLERVRDLPGYARALRQTFRRLRRGGVRGSTDVRSSTDRNLAEVLRLYDGFRSETAQFYDEEDLLGVAAGAVRQGRAAILADLGALYVMPPGAQTAGSDALLEALRETVSSFESVVEVDATPTIRLVLAPDPSSEAREVVREVIGALESGLAIHEVAVFHGAGTGYPRLLREAFQSARVPSVDLPGTALTESATGRAVLALLNLPEQGFPRTRAMDFFAIAPLRRFIPAEGGDVLALAGAWDRASRQAGITRGLPRWSEGLEAFVRDLDRRLAEDPRVRERESLKRRHNFERERAEELRRVMAELGQRLAPLQTHQPAAKFIAAFTGVVNAYVDRDADGYEDVLREISQLGTVDAVGGTFNLRSFLEALTANLESGVLKEARPRMGDGVLIADYRIAAGLRFRHVVLCGAFEGALPAGPGADPILDDHAWSRLREEHPFVEDARLRVERGRDAALRAVRSAGDGAVTWSCPLYEPGATRDFYPSPLMVAAASEVNRQPLTATQLRRLPAREWLGRSPSPMGTMLRGAATDITEVGLRSAVTLSRSGAEVDGTHPQRRALDMLRARRSNAFTEWDGNLAALAPAEWLAVRRAVSPTSLEHYAVCGFRYFCRTLLGINVMDEPEEREVIDPATRGSLVHDVLERFFGHMRQMGRPAVGEAWKDADRTLLVGLLEEELAEAKKRGLTGREVFSEHEARTLRADLLRFLEEDHAFRTITGAVPISFETDIPEQDVAGVALRGRVDRVDRTPGGQKAWVIDYKTGNTREFQELKRGDQLCGGTKLQLPAYLAVAGDAAESHALYWFITRRGGFEQIEFDASEQNMDMFHQTVEAIVEGVRAGSFPAVSGDEDDFRGGWDNCSFCDYTRICSRRREYDYISKSGSAGMRPWQRVSEAATPLETPE